MVDQITLNLDQSIEWISSGKILAHPTEGVWGLGCDALNKEAYLNLFKLKKRNEVMKNNILREDAKEGISAFIEKRSPSWEEE